MAEYLGQNPTEVRELANLFETKASDLEGVISAINSKLGATTWVGNDRNRFQNDTWTTLQNSLNTIAQSLREAGTVARNNAAEQESASA